MDHLIECADDVNKRISAVIDAALQGDEKYRNVGRPEHIHWGIVEAYIHKAVYEAFGIPLKDSDA